jgi:transcriptional regulator with GAF, ATPase, and Fis domain
MNPNVPAAAEMHNCIHKAPPSSPRQTVDAGLARDMDLVKNECGLIVEGDPGMLEVLNRLRVVTRIERINMVLLGETGTGKEMFAHASHVLSNQREKPYVTFNCAGSSEGTLQSELFGHEKGAFTGADKKRPGRFGLIENGGTLFLDEVGDMPGWAQGHLLRVLESRRHTPIGSDVDKPFAGNIIFATNADLDGRTADGNFRSDLRGRLVPVRIPPFRNRTATHKAAVITQLATVIANDLGVAAVHVNDDALDYLLGHPLPRNVRQIRDGIRMAAGYSLVSGAAEPVVTKESIVREIPPDQSLEKSTMLPHWANDPKAITHNDTVALLTEDGVLFTVSHLKAGYTKILQEISDAAAVAVLAAMDNNQMQAAKALNMARATLRKIVSRVR